MGDSVYKYFVVRSVPLFPFHSSGCCECIFVFAFIQLLFLCCRHCRCIGHKVGFSSAVALFFFLFLLSRICQDHLAGVWCITRYPATDTARSNYFFLPSFHCIASRCTVSMHPIHWSHTKWLFGAVASCSEWAQNFFDCCKFVFCNIIMHHVSFDHPTNCKSFSTHFSLHTHTHAWSFVSFTRTLGQKLINLFWKW